MCGGSICISRPRARSKRSIAWAAEEKLFVGAGYHDRDFVFCHPDGRPYEPDRFSREFLRKQLQYNRAHPDEPLPRLVLHGLRHTWATLALREGIDIQVVSERLNHSSTHVTREIYIHVTPPMQATRLNALRDPSSGEMPEARSRRTKRPTC